MVRDNFPEVTSHTKLFEKYSGAFTTSEKLFGPPGTPGVFYKSYKNIYKLERYSGASTTSEKCLGPPGTPGVF